MVLTPALLAQYALVFLAQLGMGIVAPTLPVLQQDFAISTGEVALILAVFGIARLCSDVPTGLMADRLPRLGLLVAGLVAMAGGAALCAVAPTFPLLLAGRVVQGLGSSLTYTTSQVVLVAATSPHQRGRAMGLYQAANLAGMILSPAIGGVIAAVASWRAAFAFCAVATGLSLTATLLARRVLQQHAEPRRRPALGDEPFVAGVLTTRGLFAINFVSFTIFFSGQGIINTLVPLYGGRALHLSTAVLGLALGLSGVVRLVLSVGGGVISDRFGRRALLVPALVVLGVGMSAITLATDATSFVLIVTLSGLGRLGNGVPATLLADLTPRERLGVTLGFNRFIGDVGLSIGPLLVGWVIDAAGYAPATWLVTLLMWAGALALLGWVPESLPRRRTARPAGSG